jgi:3-hydroxybutyryl-CoA dehydratase
MTREFAPGSAFDDLQPGDVFATQGRTITEADVVGFSALTGDRHPLHTDAVWAQRSKFGGRVAHGLLLLSCAVGLAPLDPEQVIAMRGIDRVTFRRPVRIGETIHLRGEVEELQAVDELSGLVGFRWELLNEREQVVARARVTVLWRRRAEVGAERSPTADLDLREVYL